MQIRDFYRDKTLLITGCTGFLGMSRLVTICSMAFIGKVVLEKILRVLPDVKKIYLLTRPKVSGAILVINGCVDVIEKVIPMPFFITINSL